MDGQHCAPVMMPKGLQVSSPHCPLTNCAIKPLNQCVTAQYTNPIRPGTIYDIYRLTPFLLLFFLMFSHDCLGCQGALLSPRQIQSLSLSNTLTHTHIHTHSTLGRLLRKLVCLLGILYGNHGLVLRLHCS